MQMRDQAKTATPDLTSGWKSIPGEIYSLRPISPDVSEKKTFGTQGTKAKESATNG